MLNSDSVGVLDIIVFALLWNYFNVWVGIGGLFVMAIIAYMVSD
jgi:hypothetical protein